jgi:anti-anti-sigma factor
MKFTLTDKDEQLAFIKSHGDIFPSLATSPEHPIEKLLGMGCYSNKVLLDLEDTKSINSEGVSWLLRCHQNFDNAGGKLVMHSASPMVDRVLQLLNLDRILHIAENQEAAKSKMTESE